MIESSGFAREHQEIVVSKKSSFWKKTFVGFAGDQQTAVKYRTAIYLGGASVAESVQISNLSTASILMFDYPTDSSLTFCLHLLKLLVYVSSLNDIMLADSSQVLQD